MAERLEESQGLESTTVGINRTATTVKGGRRMSFSALVVVGDRNGSVGIGYGKGRGVPIAIEKAQKDAKKNIFKVSMRGGTLTHPTTGRFSASKVRLIPAAPGTGVIAGGTVRAVLEMAGVRDCLTKAYGSTNNINLSKAVVQGLKGLRTREDIARLRGVEIETSTVDEMLETSRRSMSEQTSETAAAASEKTTGKGKPRKTEPRTERTGQGQKQADGTQQGKQDVPTEPAQAASAPHAPEHVDQSADAHEAVETSKNPMKDNVTLENSDTPTAQDVPSDEAPQNVEGDEGHQEEQKS